MVKGRGGKGGRAGRGGKGGRGAESPSPSSSGDSKADETGEKENKRCLNVLVLGHTASGKSTALQKIDELEKDRVALEKTTKKFKEIAMDESRQSRFLEHDMDKNEDNLEQGNRATFGEVKYETKTSIIHFLEAKSDYQYVPNLMSKAMQADIAVLFVSASDDEDEIKDDEKSKQSQECCFLILNLAIRKILVVVSKMDATSWKHKSYKLVDTDLTKFLKKYGFKAHVDLKFLPLSVRNGWNLQTKMGEKVCAWFKGPCLFEALDAFEVPSRIKKSLDYNKSWDTHIDDLVRVDLCIDKNPSDSASWHSRSITLEEMKYYAASFEAAEKAAQHGFCPIVAETCVASLMTTGNPAILDSLLCSLSKQVSTASAPTPTLALEYEWASLAETTRGGKEITDSSPAIPESLLYSSSKEVSTASAPTPTLALEEERASLAETTRGKGNTDSPAIQESLLYSSSKGVSTASPPTPTLALEEERTSLAETTRGGKGNTDRLELWSNEHQNKLNETDFLPRPPSSKPTSQIPMPTPQISMSTPQTSRPISQSLFSRKEIETSLKGKEKVVEKDDNLDGKDLDDETIGVVEDFDKVVDVEASPYDFPTFYDDDPIPYYPESFNILSWLHDHQEKEDRWLGGYEDWRDILPNVDCPNLLKRESLRIMQCIITGVIEYHERHGPHGHLDDWTNIVIKQVVFNHNGSKLVKFECTLLVQETLILGESLMKMKKQEDMCNVLRILEKVVDGGDKNSELMYLGDLIFDYPYEGEHIYKTLLLKNFPALWDGLERAEFLVNLYFQLVSSVRSGSNLKWVLREALTKIQLREKNSQSWISRIPKSTIFEKVLNGNDSNEDQSSISVGSGSSTSRNNVRLKKYEVGDMFEAVRYMRATLHHFREKGGYALDVRYIEAALSQIFENYIVDIYAKMCEAKLFL